jgi:isochorismate pyruvate lyase
MIEPEDCTTMAGVRAGVDETDRELAALIGRRFRYMNAAARIKPLREHVRDEGRKAQVIANVAQQAAVNGWPPEVATALWETLVEASIAYELAAFDRLRTSDAA